jgi:polyisoprenoid-binding protein YceI
MNFKLKITLASLMPWVFICLAHAKDVYRTDPEHTFISFSYKHFNYSTQTIRFDSNRGTITIDHPNNGSIDMIVDINSISSGSARFNKILLEDGFFAAEKFPIATFKSEKIILNNSDLSSIQGELTIKGITKPVLAEVSHFNCGRSILTLQYTCGANATIKLKRSEFDLGKYTPVITDEVTINIAIEAIRE